MSGGRNIAYHAPGTLVCDLLSILNICGTRMFLVFILRALLIVILISVSQVSLYIQGVFKKKERTFAIRTKVLSEQHFKHCHHQNNPFYWRYAVLSVSYIDRMLPGTRLSVMPDFPESPQLLSASFQNDFKFGKQEKVCWG